MMTENKITEEIIRGFEGYLREEEKSAGTIDKYLRDTRELAAFLGGRPCSKEAASAWKGRLVSMGRKPGTVNSKLAAANALFRFLGREDWRCKYLKVQRRLFQAPERVITREEYTRLVKTAYDGGQERLGLLMETICATGIRVSEVKYITVETVRQGRAEVSLKGKVRSVLLPGKLCRKLEKYARKQKITSGEIFLNRQGKGESRRQIWAEMKKLCEKAGVAASKVFPHNLRHLFAVCYYKACKNIARLADVLGHSSIETTRIYLVTSGEEHMQALERLRLVI